MDPSSVARWIRAWLAGTPPPNVWFGVSVEDQPRADERIPLLLDIPALVRWLSVEPLIGPVDLSGQRLEWLAPFHETDPLLVRTPRVDWVVVGGESGPGARPCDVEWIRDIVRECQSAAVPVFVKQLGARPDMAPVQHPKGGDPAEWPDDLRVRQYPEVKP